MSYSKNSSGTWPTDDFTKTYIGAVGIDGLCVSFERKLAQFVPRHLPLGRDILAFTLFGEVPSQYPCHGKCRYRVREAMKKTTTDAEPVVSSGNELEEIAEHIELEPQQEGGGDGRRGSSSRRSSVLRGMEPPSGTKAPYVASILVNPLDGASKHDIPQESVAKMEEEMEDFARVLEKFALLMEAVFSDELVARLREDEDYEEAVQSGRPDVMVAKLRTFLATRANRVDAEVVSGDYRGLMALATKKLSDYENGLTGLIAAYFGFIKTAKANNLDTAPFDKVLGYNLLESLGADFIEFKFNSLDNSVFQQIEREEVGLAEAADLARRWSDLRARKALQLKAPAKTSAAQAALTIHAAETPAVKSSKRKNKGHCYNFSKGECRRGDGCRFAHVKGGDTKPKPKCRVCGSDHQYKDCPTLPAETRARLQAAEAEVEAAIAAAKK